MGGLARWERQQRQKGLGPTLLFPEPHPALLWPVLGGEASSQEGLSRCKHFPGKECAGRVGLGPWRFTQPAGVNLKKSHPGTRTAFVNLNQNLAAPLLPRLAHPTWASEPRDPRRLSGSPGLRRGGGEARAPGQALLAEGRPAPEAEVGAQRAGAPRLSAPAGFRGHRRISGPQTWELSYKRSDSIL